MCFDIGADGEAKPSSRDDDNAVFHERKYSSIQMKKAEVSHFLGTRQRKKGQKQQEDNKTKGATLSVYE